MRNFTIDGEEDSWRHNLEEFRNLCGKFSYEVDVENIPKTMHISSEKAWEILSSAIRSGRSTILGQYFRSNTSYAEFERKFNNSPRIRDVCTTEYYCAEGRPLGE